jgi:NAD(P)-dependent dehydrogenase (short-subunit alcohol dehydrogenase family)
MNLTGTVVVVTGGGNGIGRQVVLLLLERGARVVALDLSGEGLEETAALAGAGRRLTTRVLDVADRDAVLALPQEVLATYGRVDGLVNVAGIVHDFRPVAELPLATIEKVMAVNFWGTVNTTKAFLPLLEQRPEACLVNVASMGALVPFPGQSAYGASKAAVKLFTEGLVAEHQDGPLKVTVVFPGGTDTGILEHSGVALPRAAADASASADITSAEDAARQIVDAVENGDARVVIGKDARMLDRISRLMPTRAVPLIARRMARMVQ